MQARRFSGWAVALAMVAYGSVGSIRTLHARSAPNTVQGTVVSVTNNSITISVKQKNADDTEMTFACSAQTKVGLKTPDGIQQVGGTTIGAGDKVVIRMSVHGSQNYVADGILIVSQAGSKPMKKPAKSQ